MRMYEYVCVYVCLCAQCMFFSVCTYVHFCALYAVSVHLWYLYVSVCAQACFSVCVHVFVSLCVVHRE